MKQYLLTILFILIEGFLSAQSSSTLDSNYTLRIERIQNIIDLNAAVGYCNSNEMNFTSDCLSDFILKEKKYLYHRVINITADSIIIALPGENNPEISISPQDILSLTTITWCYNNKVLGWQPGFFESKDYTFSLIKKDQKGLTFAKKLCWDEDCEKLYIGYLYCNSKLGCKYIFKKDGAYYLYGEGDSETVKLDVKE
jgi:hypothetical protein